MALVLWFEVLKCGNPLLEYEQGMLPATYTLDAQ